MPRGCVVPSCKIKKSTKKISAFTFPSDPKLREKWINNIPGVSEVKKNQCICEKHFEPDLIIRSYAPRDTNGKILFETPYLRVKLKRGAVPTIFEETNLDPKSKPDHSYCFTLNVNKEQIEMLRNQGNKTDEENLVTQVDNNNENLISTEVKKDRNCDNSNNVIQDPLENNSNDLNEDTCNNSKMSEEEEVKEEIFENASGIIIECDNSDENIIKYTFEQHCDDLNEDTCYQSENSEIEEFDPLMEVDKEIPESTMDSENQKAPVIVQVPVKSDITVTFETDQASFLFDTIPNQPYEKSEYSIKIPKPWTLNKSIIYEEEAIAFSYLVKTQEEKSAYIFEKTVIIKKSREMIYEVFCLKADVSAAKLPKRLYNIDYLPEILKKFRDIRVCRGVTIDSKDFVDNTLIRSTYGPYWRHEDCTLVSISKEKCIPCRKYAKNVYVKKSRMRIKENMKRIRTVENQVYQIKLESMKEKIKSQAILINALKRALIDKPP